MLDNRIIIHKICFDRDVSQVDLCILYSPILQPSFSTTIIPLNTPKRWPLIIQTDRCLPSICHFHQVCPKLFELITCHDFYLRDRILCIFLFLFLSLSCRIKNKELSGDHIEIEDSLRAQTILILESNHYCIISEILPLFRTYYNRVSCRFKEVGGVI